MKLTVISDTHNFHKQVGTLPKQGDLLIHCGDFTPNGVHKDVYNFLHWFQGLDYKYKIFIAGNHDISFQDDYYWKKRLLGELDSNVYYLENSGVEIEGYYFWGSPWTPHYGHWAFTYDRNDAWKIWRQIPRKTDILITHGPPYKILDKAKRDQPPYPQDTGCVILRHQIEELKPKYHLFGHLHEEYGIDDKTLDTICINASICNYDYRPLNKPITIDLSRRE